MGRYPDFEQNQLLICPPTVRGYALDKKSWVELLVDKVQVINEHEKRNEYAFDNLVLSAYDEKRNLKGLIRSLVQNHARGGTEKPEGVPGHLEDLIPGKGQGLVILLYGGVSMSFHNCSVAVFANR